MDRENYDDVKDKLKKYAVELGLSQEAINTSYHLLESFQRKNLEFDKNEIAAGVVYFGAIMSGERRTQKAVAKVAKMTANKVGKGYKQLRKNVDVDIVL